MVFQHEEELPTSDFGVAYAALFNLQLCDRNIKYLGYFIFDDVCHF